jgi:hypothetical protein
VNLPSADARTATRNRGSSSLTGLLRKPLPRPKYCTANKPEATSYIDPHVQRPHAAGAHVAEGHRVAGLRSWSCAHAGRICASAVPLQVPAGARYCGTRCRTRARDDRRLALERAKRNRRRFSATVTLDCAPKQVGLPTDGLRMRCQLSPVADMSRHTHWAAMGQPETFSRRGIPPPELKAPNPSLYLSACCEQD